MSEECAYPVALARDALKEMRERDYYCCYCGGQIQLTLEMVRKDEGDYNCMAGFFCPGCQRGERDNGTIYTYSDAERSKNLCARVWGSLMGSFTDHMTRLILGLFRGVLVYPYSVTRGWCPCSGYCVVRITALFVITLPTRCGRLPVGVAASRRYLIVATVLLLMKTHY